MRHRFDDRSWISVRSNPISLSRAPQLSTSSEPALHSCVPPMSGAVIESFAHHEDRVSEGTERLFLSKVVSSPKFFGCSDICWTSPAEIDSMGENDIALYRVGHGDPNAFIAHAMAAGVAGVLTEQLLPCPIPQCVVGDVDRALAEIAAGQCDRPDRKLLTVGVLGTNGKTTICRLISAITESAGLRTAYQSDLGSSDGVVQEASDRSIPRGAELVRWLADASDCLSRLAVIEVDESAARKGYYDSIEFDVLIVADRCQQSDDFGPCGLLCLLDRLSPSGVVIIPDRDKQSESYLEQSQHHVVRYGTSSESEFAAIPIDQSGGMSTLMLASGDTSAIMETPLCGVGMARNVAAATSLGSLLGLSLHQMGESLAAVRSIEGRGQRLISFGKATVVYEIGGNKERIRSALKTAKDSGNGGRTWCVMAIGEQHSSDQLAAFGGVLEKRADHCILTSQSNAANGFLARSHQVLDGVKECAAVRVVADFRKAIQWAIDCSRPRDTVVIITNVTGETPERSHHNAVEVTQFIKKLHDRIENPDAQSGSSSSDGTEGQKISLKLFPG